MNIVFLSIGGVQDLGESAVYPDLLKHFRDNGHSVYVVCQRERRSGLPTKLSTEHGIKVLRVKTGNITKVNFLEKGISTLLIGGQYKKAIAKYFNNVNFDLVLYSTPPITISSTVAYLKKRDNSFTYLMLKDIFPQNALDIEILKKNGWKGLVTKYFISKEKELYTLSDFIGCMSEANVKFVLNNNKYLNKEKVGLCPNTINSLVAPLVDKQAIRDEFNLPNNKQVFIYGGNFGKPQDVDFIIKVLKKNEKNKDVHFVMCGSGTEFYKIKEYAKQCSQEYLTVMESLNKNEYNKLLSSCDIGLIFLDYRFTIPNFPSRVLDYMNHGMPILAATDKSTDIGEKIINGKIGWWCKSNDALEYQSVIEHITSNPHEIEEKGKKSKEYLENQYETSIAYKYIIDAYRSHNNLEVAN